MTGLRGSGTVQRATQTLIAAGLAGWMAIATVNALAAEPGTTADESADGSGDAQEEAKKEPIIVERKKICRTETTTGSIMSKRVCRTPEEIAKLEQDSRATLDRLTREQAMARAVQTAREAER